MFRLRRALFAAILTGIPVGLGLFTFHYAEGFSAFPTIRVRASIVTS